MRLQFLSLAVCLIFSHVAFGEPTADAGKPIVINPNGGWSWFSDERAVVDVKRGILYVGSLANRSGQGGADKDGDVEVTQVDLSTGSTSTAVLRHALLSYGGGDDHNCPALLVLPDGRCLAAYCGHNNAPQTYFRTFDPEAQQWGEERMFDWGQAIPGGSDFGCTYNNLFYLPRDGTIVDISRNHHRCPNVIMSKNLGATWKYSGQLLAPTAVEDATGFYVNGYLKYSQREERIDLLATERHPRNFSNNLFHGYLADGALHRADGVVVDKALDAQPLAKAVDLTRVFTSGTKLDGTVMNRAWMVDFEHYPDGQLAAVFEVRAADSVDDHRFFFAAYRHGEWTAGPLAEAGPRLFRREEDYTGLAALDPNTPGVVYISTPIDPGTGNRQAHHELYQGKSDDGGAAWNWRAVTQDSAADNLRPIVPRWSQGRTALVWTRGTMTSSQDYDLAVMLLIDPFGGD